MITILKKSVDECVAIGIGPLPPIYHPPQKPKTIPPVERKDPVKKTDKEKENKNY